MGIELILEMTRDALADRIALGERSGGITYRQLGKVVDGGASVLAASKARSVAFVGVTGSALPALVLASAKAGMPFTPLNYRLPQAQLDELISELDSPFVVADGAFIDVVTPTMTTDVWFDQALSAEPVTLPSVADDAPAVVLFTSGTTSKPKGVVLRHRHLLAYVLETVDFASADPEDAVLVSVPPYHIAGVGSALSNLYAGRRTAYLPDFSPSAWLSLVRSDSITNAMVVPTMLARIVGHLEASDAGTPSLRAIAYGGARMPQTVLRAALEAFPTTEFVNAYGLTETSSTIAVLGPDDHRSARAGDPIALARLKSVGRMVPGIECSIRDVDGTELAVGATGEIWVRGSQVSGEYQGIGSVLDPEGWFPTRDHGYVDEGGYLFVDGRSDDTIIRGGENISPAEIEDVLVEHPDVDQVAVLGVPDDEWGERIVAVVVPHASATPREEALREFVRARLRSSRTPDEVVFRGELPYSATGKLLRRTLLTTTD
jgi:acyl-CoA synthetase (AMP-forming)/AMP-acid ligase II